jgi:hypothetical protein
MSLVTIFLPQLIRNLTNRGAARASYLLTAMSVQSAWSFSLALLDLDSMITTNSTVSNNWAVSIFIGDAVSTQTL